MIEPGDYKIVDYDFNTESVIKQNNLLKKQNSKFKTWFAISLIVVGVAAIYLIRKNLRKNELDD